MESKVTLGKAAEIEAGTSALVLPETIEDRLSALEAKITIILRHFEEHRETEREIQNTNDPNVNKDGIPFHQNFVGVTHGVRYILTVRPDAYYVNHMPFPTLSAAALGVSGVRRSGWTFWRLPDGRTAKEMFKK